MTASPANGASTFLPGISVQDPEAEAWLRQASLRLRREVAWRWHQHGVEASGNGQLPPANDSPLVESLDLTRHWNAKQTFFSTDATARYLSDALAQLPARDSRQMAQGSFSWLLRELALDEVSSFALALGLLARLDAAAGAVFAACAGDSHLNQPTLALVQRLWDEPQAAVSLADPGHTLWTYGVLHASAGPGTSAIAWDASYSVPPLVSTRLLFPSEPLPRAMEQLRARESDVPPPAAAPLLDRLRLPAHGLRIVPVKAPGGADASISVASVAQAAGRNVWRLSAEAALAQDQLPSFLTVAWLAGGDLYLRVDAPSAEDRTALPAIVRTAVRLPVTLYLEADEATLGVLPAQLTLPRLEVPPLTYQERVCAWQGALGAKARGLDDAIHECSRRFRFQPDTIEAVAAGLKTRRGRIKREQLFAACRAAMPLDTSGLAQPVTPRFDPKELVLPEKQDRQLKEIENAMRSLAEVHYAWGTARVWNEGGISVLFAGPSGTGKTMAAEVLSATLDIPMVRINLAQVVNKYIGETEKNLERIFDAADAVETLLFFDEADALFGRRTEVRDAHDRYANLEVSYLLERMERFKGLAILATNRRNDLDEAFLRRLTAIVDFPVPDAPERRRIWEAAIPAGVDGSGLDYDFLARHFHLTGGNIRSAVFAACLQAASAPRRPEERPRLDMERVVVAVKREYDKLQRSVSLMQFGPYAKLIEGLGDD